MNTLPNIPNWTVILLSDITANNDNELDFDLEPFFNGEPFEVDNIICVLVSSKGYHVRYHESGKFSAIAMNNSSYGSLQDCITLIEAEMGESVN